jgi:hypothetical protein
VASNIYYGICTTAGNEQNKQVRLANVSSESEGLHLQKGDILSVYFVHKNEANGVTLTLSIGDINQEYNTSVSVDESGFNTSIIGVAPGAWTDGEVVNFSYTHNGSVVENADNSYYWEMVGKPIATSNTYGDVILDGQNLATAASQNRVNELINARGVNGLSYDTSYDSGINIGTLSLNTYYSDGRLPQLGEPITITIPNIPTKVNELENNAGYLTKIIGSSLLFNGTESNSKQIGINTEGGIESGTVIIDLCDDSNSDTIINSLHDINLNPTNQVNITLPANKQLNVSGGNGIACNKLDILNDENNRLIVDTISSHSPSPNLITFESPVSISNGPNVVNGLQTDGITINNQSLEDYIISRLGNNNAKEVLNNWLTSKLDGYLKTKRYYYGPVSNLGIGTGRAVVFGDTNNYWYLDENGTRHDVTGDLNLDGYDIVGVITWEAWKSNTVSQSNPYRANIYGICWKNNDPATGILTLMVTAVGEAITAVNISVDILYKKQL